MSAVAVLIPIGTAAIAFLIYVFVALCKEGQRGECNVVYIGQVPEHDEAETLRNPSQKVVEIGSRKQAQSVVGVHAKRAS